MFENIAPFDGIGFGGGRQATKETIEMRFAICIAILVLVPALGQAQVAAKTNKLQVAAKPVDDGNSQSTDAENQQLLAAALLHSYATSVNNLLSNLANRLQVISQHAAAGEVSQQNALLLKFAATRATIARLETISAVYDSQLVSNEDDLDSDDGAVSTLRSKSTVSVKELQHEGDK
jgi:hypothetical protein